MRLKISRIGSTQGESMEQPQICTTQQPTARSPILEKIENIAIHNKEAGIAIATSIAIAIVLYGGAKAAETVIKAWRN
ncbi:MAG: hypothetical protein J7647_11125 [Cyanobacteria bacterium SBLK]|nr:hypothetical protein [Cyanobacteria bacterium SBLK]